MTKTQSTIPVTWQQWWWWWWRHKEEEDINHTTRLNTTNIEVFLMKSTELLRTSKRYTLSGIFIWYHYYHLDEWIESNPNKESNWMKNLMGPTKTRMISEREKGKKWHIPIGTQSPNTGTQKKGEEGHFFWRGNSYSSNQEKRRMCSGVIIICMVPIGRFIIHRTQHVQYW